MAGPSWESQISIAAWSSFPGFRFSPTDEELISYYLKKKMDGCENSVEVIAEIEICRHEPWDLPAKSIIQSNNEWFFFSARGRKYPNGSQSRRATELGYWKATGKERNVKAGNAVIGTKRTLVFHLGRAPKGERTGWIMHEYCMHGKSQDTPVICRLRRNTEFRLNDASNRASDSQGHAVVMANLNHAVSDGGTELTDHLGVSGGDRAVAGARARRTSSSYDSHSVGQLDSTSESNQKLLGEAAQAAESSIHLKDSDKDDDFYADILKDDIIKLDESAMSGTPNALLTEKSRLEAEKEAWQSMQASLAPVTVACTASRRVRINEQLMEEQPQESTGVAAAMEGLGFDNHNKEEYNAGKDKGLNMPNWVPSCIVTRGFAGINISIASKVEWVMGVLFLVLAVWVLYIKFWH